MKGTNTKIMMIGAFKYWQIKCIKFLPGSVKYCKLKTVAQIPPLILDCIIIVQRCYKSKISFTVVNKSSYY